MSRKQQNPTVEKTSYVAGDLFFDYKGGIHAE